MSSTRLYRFSGISLLLGCVIIFLVTIPGVFIGNDPASTYAMYSSLGRVLGGMLLVLGFPGVYARQSQRAGVLGLIGFVLTLIYILMLGVFGDTFDALIVPFIATHAPSLMKSEPPALDLFYMIGGILGVVGGVLLGIATIRASVLSRWAAILLIVGSVVQFLGDVLNLPIANPGFLLFMIGLAWLGLGVVLAKQPLVSTPAEIPAGAVRS
jgi:hypothetical protein